MLFPRSKIIMLLVLLLTGGLVPAVDAAQVTQQEINEALENLRRHAEAGNPTAQFHLAQEYFRGKYVPQNNELGISWARRAAEGGEIDAQIGMGVLYHFGENMVEPDYEKAMYWYRKAADGHAPLAYTYIGILYHAGLGVAMDDALAIKWLTKGAQNEDSLGQAVLGRMYLDGDGAPRDYKKAMYWLTKSANAGRSLGEYNLGRIYEFGLGVEKDQKKALHWYKKAANQGQQEAQRRLAQIERTATPDTTKSVPQKRPQVEVSALASDKKPLPKPKQKPKQKPRPKPKPITVQAKDAKQSTPSVAAPRNTPLPSVPAGSYTLQLMAVKDVANAVAFNNKYKIKGQIWQYQVAQTTWYLLIQGVYPDREAANRALAMLMPNLPRGSKVWVRPVDDLRKKDVTVRNLPIKESQAPESR